MKKILLAALVLVASIMPSFAGKKFSEQEQAVIDKFWNFRMELTLLDENQDAVNAIDTFKANNQDQINQLGEEASLLLDALIIMERYNYIYTFPGENKESRKPFSEMRNKLKAFMENKTEKELTPYIYLCYADITSYYMAYSIKDIILNGMTVKRNQEKAIKVCDEFSPAMVNLAQWYYYSPKIFGGSKDMTREWQLKSIEYARTKSEQFYARTAYSQFLFEMGELEESRKELEECERLCPGSNFIKLLKEQNAMGNSLNDYNKQRSKLLKSADDYRKRNNIKD
ncbi:hypothetical protein [Treponema sp.]|uniref:hypothetical protein n=1 Tax=Treponema sp. TaxID=166 RepID=UPI00298D7F7E|nr:hypothetical protein [Treponema sp.]MCQ2241311.1 hypothetical protein [Treponema sp.]